MGIILVEDGIQPQISTKKHMMPPRQHDQKKLLQPVTIHRSVEHTTRTETGKGLSRGSNPGPPAPKAGIRRELPGGPKKCRLNVVDKIPAASAGIKTVSKVGPTDNPIAHAREKPNNIMTVRTILRFRSMLCSLFGGSSGGRSITPELAGGWGRI